MITIEENPGWDNVEFETVKIGQFTLEQWGFPVSEEVYRPNV